MLWILISDTDFQWGFLHDDSVLISYLRAEFIGFASEYLCCLKSLRTDTNICFDGSHGFSLFFKSTVGVRYLSRVIIGMFLVFFPLFFFHCILIYYVLKLTDAPMICISSSLLLSWGWEKVEVSTLRAILSVSLFWCFVWTFLKSFGVRDNFRILPSLQSSLSVAIDFVKYHLLSSDSFSSVKLSNCSIFAIYSSGGKLLQTSEGTRALTGFLPDRWEDLKYLVAHLTYYH